MSTPPESFSSQDQQWLDRLSGKLTSASDPQAIYEADLLRQAILREAALESQRSSLHEVTVTSGTSVQTEAKPGQFVDTWAVDDLLAQEEQIGKERLMFALRREGLLPTASQISAQATHAKKRNVWAMPTALAASVLLGFLSLQALQNGADNVQYDEPPVMRGQVQQISMTHAAPKTRAREISEQLKAVGLNARIYQAGKTYIVDIDLVAEKLETSSKALNSLGLQATAGQARIEIHQP